MEKGLIIQKVWLDKIFDEGKTWEMRSTKTNVTGKIGCFMLEYKFLNTSELFSSVWGGGKTVFVANPKNNQNLLTVNSN